MFTRILKVLAVGCLALVTLYAQTIPEYPEAVSIGGSKAHPTRLLARVKVGDGESLGTLQPQAEAVAKSMGLRVSYRYSLVPGLLLLDEADANVAAQIVVTEPTRVARLANRARVLVASGLFQYVTPDWVGYVDRAPSDSAFQDGTLWGLQNTGQNGGLPGADINATAAWDITTGTNTVVIASIDTGVRYTHFDLAANMWHNPGEIAGNGVDDDKDGYVDDVYGINAITGSGDPFDDFGHGTHTAGTFGAVANNGYPHVGVNWSVQIMACKWISAQGSGFVGNAIKCIEYAVLKKVPISNNSWHLPAGTFTASDLTALQDAIFAANQAGHLFVCAAGNDSQDHDLIPDYPSSFRLPNMIVVAAIDRKDQIASFSDYGLTTVDIGAPGVEIYSTFNGSDSDYQVEQGTSMASPHVAGVAGLVLASHPTANVAELRARILNSAVQTPALIGKVISGGRVSAYNALIGIVTGTNQISVTPADQSTLLVDTTNIFAVKVSDILPITNATVTAAVTGPGYTNVALSFTNNGVYPDLVAADDIYSGLFIVTNAGSYTVVFQATSKAKSKGVITNHYTLRARPVNDAFAGAIKLAPTGGTFFDTNSLATIQPNEPQHGGDANVSSSLWYTYSPIQNNTTLINTLGTEFPTVVAVYTGSSLATLTSVASAVGTLANPGVQLTFPAQQAVTYHIAVASATTNLTGVFRVQVTPNGLPDTTAPVITISDLIDGTIFSTNVISLSGIATDPQPYASGVRQVTISLNGSQIGVTGTNNWTATRPLTLNPGVNTISVSAVDFAGNISTPINLTAIYRVVAPANDAFSAALPLVGNNGSDTGSNVNATKEPGEPNHGGNSGGASVWWSFTSPVGGQLLLNTTNSSFDTLLGVYTGSQVDELTTLGENDDEFSGSGYSALAVAVPPATTVYIAVDGFGGAMGNVQLNYEFVPVPLVSLTVDTSGDGLVLPGSSLVGSNTIVTLTAYPGSRSVFAGWSGATISLDNPLSLLVLSNATLQAKFIPIPISDDFETGSLTNLHWVTSGSAPWFVETNVVSAGKYAAQAGAIGNSEYSSLLVVTNSGGGLGSFDYKVSSELGFDFLSFYLDGQLNQQWSGEAGWATYSFNLSPGVHSFEWRYVKDAQGSAGKDTAWLDNVQLNIRPAVTSASAATVHILDDNQATVRLYVTGESGQYYWTQTSPDFKHWTTISTNINSIGAFIISRPFGTNSHQFLRTVTAP